MDSAIFIRLVGNLTCLPLAFVHRPKWEKVVLVAAPQYFLWCATPATAQSVILSITGLAIYFMMLHHGMPLETSSREKLLLLSCSASFWVFYPDCDGQCEGWSIYMNKKLIPWAVSAALDLIFHEIIGGKPFTIIFDVERYFSYICYLALAPPARAFILSQEPETKDLHFDWILDAIVDL